MSGIEIIKLVFGIMLSVGSIALFVLAYKLSYKYLVQEKRCSAKVKGGRKAVYICKPRQRDFSACCGIQCKRQGIQGCRSGIQRV